jgi:branched-chain amino acid transport system ATP-binding protein
MSDPVLRTERVTKRFGGLVAVDALSFALPGGRLHAIIGPNGAGKTTFFNLISGLLPCDGGRVFFHGRDITGLKPHQISRLGIKRTLQLKSVFPRLSVADNLSVTSQAAGRFLNPLRRRRAGQANAGKGRVHA